jgi:hypothetical protein
MRFLKTTTLAILLLAMLPLTGCFLLAAGAVAAGAYSYQTNKLVAVKNVPVDAAHKASTDALDELEIRIVRANVDKLSGLVEGQTAQNKTVTINLERIDDNSTRLNIRVGSGFLADEKSQATAIYDAISKRLPDGAPAN